MKKIMFLGSLFFLIFSFNAISQKQYPAGSKGILPEAIVVPSIADQLKNGTAIFAGKEQKKARPKGRHGAKVIPGKGVRLGTDPLGQLQRQATQRRTRTPDLVFLADNTPQAAVTDPSGAAGPNHYIGAWNFGFRIFNKSGNPLTPEMSLATLFPGNAIGDPIVFFDANVDNGPGEPRGRFVITEFRDIPTNGFDIAVSAGPDPVNDEWFIYASDFSTGNFPDYTKFAVWGDSYVVTANINNGFNGDRVFAVERNEMLQGNDAQFVGFPLPEIVAQGFYSPHGFHTTGDETVPIGTPAPIIFHQDDSFAGTTEDHLKIWGATIDWANPANHSIALEQELFGADGVTPFLSVFDGGSFSNRPQPGGPDIDVLQNTIMNQVQYRRFGTHNSVILNFVINTEGNAGELAGIRWYELRQDADGMPWTVFQEGTYNAPDGRDAYAGSMVMNTEGDIAMGYTSSSATDMISIQFTGRLDGDPLNVMTAQEQLIGQSTAPNPGVRLADYVQMSIDPVDDSFWHIAEFFSPQRSDIVGNFTMEEPMPDDIGVSNIDSPAPMSGVLTNAEEIVVSIRNFGNNDITNPMVQYSVDGVNAPAEMFNGTIVAGGTESFTFATLADLGIEGQSYTIEATTLLTGDSNTNNDATTLIILNAAELCQPASDCAGFNDGVTMIELGNQDIATNCGFMGYSDDRDLVFLIDLETDDDDLNGILQMGFINSEFAIWIDADDSGTYDDNELVANDTAGAADSDFAFTLDISNFILDDLVGTHAMRVRGFDPSLAGILLDPCADLQFGRTNDYRVTINDGTLSVADNAFNSADFTIFETSDNIFDITLRSDFNGRAAISVFNLLGQQLVFNNLGKQGDRFEYSLDMSYAPTGVYVVQFTDIDGDSSISQKIIVN